jgi:hypothetical protein
VFDTELYDDWLESGFSKTGRTDGRSANKLRPGGIEKSELLTLYVAELLTRFGYLRYGWLLFDWLSKRGSAERRSAGVIGKLSITILLCRWNMQLKHYYDLNIWVNPDNYPGFQDDLSELFPVGTKENVALLFTEARGIDPTNPLVEILHADFCEFSGDLASARRHLRLALAYAPGNPVALRKLEAIDPDVHSAGSSDTRVIHGAIRGIAELPVKRLYPPPDRQPRKRQFSYSYKVRLGEQEWSRKVTVPDHEMQLFEAGDVSVIDGLVLTRESDARGKSSNTLIRESKHIDPISMRMFSPALAARSHDEFFLQAEEKTVVRDKAFCVTGTGWSYYHWLIETLPIIKTFSALPESRDCPIYIPYKLEKWHRETLDLVGMSDVEILPHIDGKVNAFRDAILPLLSSRDLLPSYSSMRDMRDWLARPGSVKPGKRVYLTRSGVASARSMKGEKQLRHALARKGFTCVNPATMSISEQIDYFSDVEILIAEGGASNSNILFCPSETRILLLAADRALYDSFSALNAVTGQEITYQLFPSHPMPSPYYIWTSYDFNVNISSIESWISENC